VNDLFQQVKSRTLHYPVKIEEGWIPVVAKSLSVDGKQFRVELKCHEWIAKQLSGFLLRYEDHAKIYFSSTLNDCWARWVVCKEVAHLLIDTETKHYTKDPLSLVQQIISQIPNVTFNHDVNSEFLAAFAAIEMLLPWDMRPVMEKMMNDGASDLQIAKAFSAPEIYVNLVLKNEHFKKLSRDSNAVHQKRKPVRK